VKIQNIQVTSAVNGKKVWVGAGVGAAFRH